jgi:transposase
VLRRSGVLPRRAQRREASVPYRTAWSSGQVEGKINRLNLIKRQMYGRAILDLLKARLMAAA